MTDIIIVGGGMAGMTAGLYALRNNRTVKIIERESFGGQIARSPKVENYPTEKSISGVELSDKLFEQITELGAEYEVEDVINIEKIGNIFKVVTNYHTFECKSVIIASGVKPRMLNIENEDKLLGKGVYYCAICDGPFYEGKDVTLIGDANSALQYALMLAGYCKSVHVCTLFDKFFGEKVLQDAVLNTPNITVTHNLSAQKFNGKDRLESITFKNTITNETFEEKTEAVFVAIGQVPDNNAFKGLVDIDKVGYIISDESCKTKTDGLFVAGDCRTKAIRQVTTAVSDGAIAGTSASLYISSIGE